MSYCRFSSDFFRSDIYMWDDGKVLNVCVRRERSEFPADWPTVDRAYDEETYDRLDSETTLKYNSLSKVDIDHPLAGEHRKFEFASNALEFLSELKEAGFHVPDEAMERLISDIPASSHSP